MANYALLTAHGKDRPGIVAAIARVLFESDCNIEDSQMARLGPDFACMLVLRMPEGLLGEQLQERLSRVADRMGLRIHLHDLLPEEAAETQAESARHCLQVQGADRKGIVHRITEYLAARGVNITSLQTEVVRDPIPRYAMSIEVELPPFVDAQVMAGELAAIGREIQVEVSIGQKGGNRQ